MPERFMRYERMLSRWQQKGRRRRLTPQSGADFTSNDYLGIAGSARLRAGVSSALDQGVPLGAAASRLLRGNHPEHEQLEAEAAAFFGSESTLYFSSGYVANLSILSTLPQRGDLIVYDALIHASARAGIAASQAHSVAVPHNDVHAVDEAIVKWRQTGGLGQPWITVESLYSMDGDQASLGELVTLADRHEGFLVIDEAHATGVHGENGRGFAAQWEGRKSLVVLHTCGKALGATGALVSCAQVLRDFLINRAAPFMYATAPSPLAAAGVRQSLRIIVDEPQRRAALQQLTAFANEQMRCQLGLRGSDSQILPIVVGDSRCAVRMAERMQAVGFDIRAVRPPTVPTGTARLRVTITLNVDQPTIAQMFRQLAQVMVEEMQ